MSKLMPENGKGMGPGSAVSAAALPPAPALAPAKLTAKVADAATAAAVEPVVTLHRQLMYRILADESVDHICSEMNLSLSAFNTLIDSPLFKSELSSLRKKMRDKFLTSSNLSAEDRLRELNPVAIKTLTALMMADGVPKTLRRAIAKDIIDYNLKLSAERKKGTLTESTAFIIKASERAKARKRRELERERERARLEKVTAIGSITPSPLPESEAVQEEAAKAAGFER